MELEKRRVNGTTKPDTMDQDKWIHRDKLARIERTEMELAGIFGGRESRNEDRPLPNGYASRDQSVGSHAKGYSPSEADEAQSPQPSMPVRQRMASPIPDAREDEEDDGDGADPSTWGDLRLPEEAAQDPFEDTYFPPTSYKHHPLSASASKIPINTSSPIPVPYDYLERTAPVPRYAAPYADGPDDDRIAYPKSRSRGQSFGSQMLLDEYPAYSDPPVLGTPTPATRGQASPRKQGQSISANNTPRSTSGRGMSSDRKISATRSNHKARSRSGNLKEPPRPGTRSGLNGDGRPDSSGSNSKRPEGDPPWLNGIYAPDPHLPPEQQLLPTVAKRLKQQEWEREGRDPDQNLFFNEYDRDLNVLHAVEYDDRDRPQFDNTTSNPNSPTQPPPIERERTPEPHRLDPRTHQYPSRTPSPLQHRLSPAPPESSSRRPSTSNGNYKTTPAIASPALVLGPAGQDGPGSRFDRMDVEQGQQGWDPLDADERTGKGGKKKGGGGCACCAIM